MEQAEEALAAAKLLFKSEMCRQAAGRAYYAMFYAVTALLALRKLGTSKHAGALTLFDREFVKNGRLYAGTFQEPARAFRFAPTGGLSRPVRGLA